MLINLSIKNYTLISALELDFRSQMTVITGETGAGKSIVLDSLELALGERAEHAVIKHGTERAEVCATFDITNFPQISDWLATNDLDSNNECIVRRIITQDGRSKSFINGSAAPLNLTRELASKLASVHGQHEHQALLKTDKQLECLDSFAGNAKLCSEVKQIHSQWLKTKKELEHLQTIAENYQAKLDFTNYQLQELDALHLQPDEPAQLHQEHTALTHAAELTTTVSAALQLTSDDEENTILQQLHCARNLLGKTKITDTKISSIIELFDTAVIQIEEAADGMQRYLNAVNLSHERLAAVEQRLNDIHALARKHRVNPADLPSIYANLRNDLLELQNFETKLQATQNNLAALEKQYHTIAEQLSAKRKQAAAKLNTIITEKIQLLGMSGGKFAIHFTPNSADSIRATGAETAEFLVSTNPGQPLQSMAKTASGGELSRIGLAIRVITAQNNTTPILIFDEVDVGIGGKTAEIVGKMLRELAQNNQVICVTHLPQVAVHGQQHLNISKQNNANNTQISINYLTKKQQINEISRMLGGINITPQIIATATEMLEGAR